MEELVRSWTSGEEILAGDEILPVRQVYTWLLCADNKIVIVSKDGSVWQLPGGKPEPSESMPETAQREVAEETSVDISAYTSNLVFFGYYRVHEPGADTVDYLQVRYYLPLPVDSSNLNLSAANEDAVQAEADAITCVTAVDSTELTRYIEWMATSPEYQELQALGLLHQPSQK